jgi:hypothetical protein
MSLAMVYFRVASQLSRPPQEITMTHDFPSAPNKPCLDDLLTTIGVTREQLMEMTADDLFAAATQWQNAVTAASAEAQRCAYPADRFLDSLPGQPASLGWLN